MILLINNFITYPSVLLLLVYTIGLWLDVTFRKINDELWLFISLFILGSVLLSSKITIFQIILFLVSTCLLLLLTLSGYIGGADFKGLSILYFYYLFFKVTSFQVYTVDLLSSRYYYILVSLFIKYILIELSYLGIFIFSNFILYFVLREKVKKQPPFFFGILVLFIYFLL